MSRIKGSPNAVSVESAARLHLGFVDLNGELGHKFGSLGLSIDGLSTRVTAKPASALEVEGADHDRAAAYARAAHGAAVRRVLIFDWDVHHGQGTQELFWADGRALVVSVHKREDWNGHWGY